jgi:hypothetical protein
VRHGQNLIAYRTEKDLLFHGKITAVVEEREVSLINDGTDQSDEKQSKASSNKKNAKVE